jgi:hypothetical protein
MKRLIVEIFIITNLVLLSINQRLMASVLTNILLFIICIYLYYKKKRLTTSYSYLCEKLSDITEERDQLKENNIRLKRMILMIKR